MKLARFRHSVLAFLAALAAAATTHAAGVVNSFSDIQYWVGSGSNQAGLVIDWNDGKNPVSMAWGFRWNGTATGEDMFKAIAGQLAIAVNPAIPGPAAPDGGGDIRLSLYILSYDFGDSVDRVAYDLGSGAGHDQNSDGFSNGFWSYWYADSASYPSTWTEAEVGFGDRILANNSWDGWSYAPDFDGVAPSQAFAAPVPEPGVAALMVAGGIVLLWRARPRHA